MNTEEKGLLNQFRHRYVSLCILRICMIFFQILILLTCSFYVLANLMKWEIPNFFIGIGINRISFKTEYWDVICFLFSIFSFFTVPGNLKEQITNLYLAIKYLKEEKRTSFQKEVIEQAKGVVGEVDLAFDKFLQGKKEEIEPHEKRMVLRRGLIVFGIIGISILTTVLIFKYGWNVPKVASIDLFIGYLLVIFEAYFYQIELKKAKIVLMEEEHKKIIVNKEDEREHFKLLQKISYMKADRLSNYSLVLSVASGATNVVSVLITILDTASDANFQRMFALEIDSVNAIVAAVFMAASVCFFIADIVVQLRIEPKILETNIQAKIPYSTENYDALCSQYEKEMNKSGFFSRNILDWARGVYEYNNDVMVRKYCRGEDVYIPYKCMATVESLYPGRVPRYKLTVLILWLCAFMAFVWGEANSKCLFPITVMAFVIYDVLLVFNATQLWNSRHEWIGLEEKIEKECSYKLRKEVKWDFIKYLLGHSVIVILIAVVNGVLKMSGNIPKLWFGMLALIVFYGFIGFSFVKKNMVIGDGDILKPYLTVGVFGTGIAAIILSDVFQGKWNDVFVSGIMILGLLAFEEVIASFYRRWRRKIERCTVQFPIGIIFIIINWGISYIFMMWDFKIVGNNRFEIFIWICVEWIIVVFCRMFWGMIQMGEEVDKTDVDFIA